MHVMTTFIAGISGNTFSSLFRIEVASCYNGFNVNSSGMDMTRLWRVFFTPNTQEGQNRFHQYMIIHQSMSKKNLKAPFLFGKTDFTLVIQDCADSEDFSGVGSDKQGEFMVKELRSPS